MITHSPYIQEMTRPPQYSFAGLIPGSETVAANDTKASAVNVPIPIPRPSF